MDKAWFIWLNRLETYETTVYATNAWAAIAKFLKVNPHISANDIETVERYHIQDKVNWSNDCA